MICIYDFFDTYTEFVNEYAAPIIIGFQVLFAILVFFYIIVIWGPELIEQIVVAIFKNYFGQIECSVSNAIKTTSHIAESSLQFIFWMLVLFLFVNLVLWLVPALKPKN